MAPVVSVIIPVYNESDVLDETLAALVAQTEENFEVICVDDGSSDDSADIIDALCATDGRFRLIRSANFGAAHARNVGLAEARGTYVIFLDADDLFRPDMLERLLASIGGTAADFCVCEADLFHEDTGESVPFVRFPKDLAAGLHRRSEFGKRLFQSFNKTAWNKLYLRETILGKNVRFQDLPNMNDISFVETMLAVSESMVVCKEALISYRRGRGASLQDMRHKRPDCTLRAAEHIHDGLIERGVLNEDEMLSLKNELWRLLIQAIESAVWGRDADVVASILAEVRRLSALWGIDALTWREYAVVEYAFWHWCLLRVSPERLIWAYDIRRAPVAERQRMVTNVLTAMRLLVATLMSRGVTPADSGV